MIEEVKTVKTIRDYPINTRSPFGKKAQLKKVAIGKKARKKSVRNNTDKFESLAKYLSDDRSFFVNVVSVEKSRNLNLTGIHKINKDQALELIGDVLKDKLEITKGGINVFKYIFNKLERNEKDFIMTFKVDVDQCRDDIGYTSTQSVWYGLAELLDKSIIARSAILGVYYLNPNFFLPTEKIVVTEYYKLM